MLIVGRALIGAGGMRVMTKKYMALMLNEKFRSKYLLLFATMGHIGKSIGPGINAICCVIIGKETEEDKQNSVFQLGNIFAFVCFVLWSFIALFMGNGFKLDKKYTQRKLVSIKKQARIEGRYFKELIQMKVHEPQKLSSEEKRAPTVSSADEPPSPNAASPQRIQGLRKLCMLG
jgi:MFS family permease